MRWARYGLIFGIALALRIAYLIQIRDNVSFQIIALDSDLYDQRALDILRGDFWGTGVFYSAPLYPYFLALLYSFGSTSFFFARLVQILLGSLTAVLVTVLGERTLDEPAPWVAGLLTALYAPFVFFNATILGTTLAALLVTLSALLLTLSQTEGKPRAIVTFVAGASIGLTSLARPNTILVLPLWILGLWLLHRRWRWVRPALILLAGSVLVIGPVTVRNAVVGGDFVPISSHGGINFWIGNHPNADGTFDLPPGIRGTPEQVNLIDSTRLASQASGRELKPSEVSTFWFRRGLEFMTDHPGETAGLWFRKARMFWNRVEIPLNVNFHFLQRASPLLRIPLMHFGLIAPFALLGMIVGLARWRTFLPAYTVAVAFFASAVAFFVSGRYRLPAVPVLILFACYAGVWIHRRIRSRSWSSLIPAGAALVVFAAHANLPAPGFDVERSFARDYYYLAANVQERGQVEKALDLYGRSLEHNPDFWLSYNGQGVCLSATGRLDEAVASFQRAVDLAPDRPEPWSNMGIALASHGQIAGAIPCWERALELDPQNEQARENLWKARGILRNDEVQARERKTR